MKKNLKFILIAVVFVAVMAGAYVLYGNLSDEYYNDEANKDQSESVNTEDDTEEKELIAAPDFTVLDKDGNQVSLSECRGRPVVIYFWSTGCPSCMVGLPNFDKATDEYGDQVLFMPINIDAKETTIDRYNEHITDSGYTFSPYYDTTFEASATYGVYTIPRSLFIDAEGYIHSAYIGVLNETAIRSNIESILNK